MNGQKPFTNNFADFMFKALKTVEFAFQEDTTRSRRKVTLKKEPLEVGRFKNFDTSCSDGREIM